MLPVFEESGIVRLCRKGAKGFKETVEKSLLFGKRPADTAMEQSGIAQWMGRTQPMEKLMRGLSKSGILGWLYDYGVSLCRRPLKEMAALPVSLFLILAVRMLVAGRLAMGGILFLCAVASLALLLAKGSLADWLGGSVLGKYLPLPQGEGKKSIAWYWAACGVLGGALGWFAGVTYGAAVAVGLLLLPAVFRIPPAWMLCLLLGLLPICGTTVCWGLSMLVVAVYFLARIFGGMKGRPFGGLDLLLMIFPLFCAVSAAFSYAKADSMKVAVMWLGLFACVPLVRRIVTDRKKLMAALAALTAGAALAGCYGLFQYLSGMTNDKWTDTALFNNIQLRVYSTFANPNVYGEFLLLTIPLIAGMALYCKGLKRWLLLAVDALLMANMLLSYSRGCYVGIAVTALVFLWYFSKKWLAVAMVVGIPLAIVLMPESVMARIMSIGNMSDTSTNYRMMIYIGTLMMLAHYWFGGLGIGELAYNAVYPFYALSTVTASHSHSLFFQLVVSFGIMGLVYVLFFWIMYQRKMHQTHRSIDRREKLLLAGFNAVMFGMMVQSAFDYTWYNYRVFQLFWLVMVLGYAAAEVLRERKAENG